MGQFVNLHLHFEVARGQDWEDTLVLLEVEALGGDPAEIAVEEPRREVELQHGVGSVQDLAHVKLD